MKNEKGQTILKATREQRYNQDGFLINYNVFEHGYYPTDAWVTVNGLGSYMNNENFEVRIQEMTS